MADYAPRTSGCAQEIWTHVLAYNLIRTITARAGSTHGLKPAQAASA
jgi:hypothetical protein